MNDVSHHLNDPPQEQMVLPPGVWRSMFPESSKAYQDLLRAWNANTQDYDEFVRSWYKTDLTVLGTHESIEVVDVFRALYIEDGHEISGVLDCFGSWESGAIQILQTNYLKFGHVYEYPNTEEIWNSYCRFQVQIPVGSKINGAKLCFRGFGQGTYGGGSFLIQGHDAIPGQCPSTAFEADTMSKTSPPIPWIISDWIIDDWNCVEITSIVEQFVQRDEYELGEFLTIFVLNNEYADRLCIASEVQLTVWHSSTYSDTMSGGVIVSGHQPPGGLLASGETDPIAFYTAEIDSGSILSGLGVISHFEVGSGGITASGEPDNILHHNQLGQSGIQVAGFAERVFGYIHVADGGISVHGSGHNIFSEYGEGSILIDGSAKDWLSFIAAGGIKASGQSLHSGIWHHGQFGGIIVFGHFPFVGNESFRSDGESLIVGGEYRGGIRDVRWISSGEIYVGNDLNPIGIRNTFVHELDFSWRIKTAVIGDISFRWSNGQLPIYWYRIVGAPRNGDECNLISEDCCQQFILNVHARTLGELCEKLSARHFNLPIQRVFRFKRPAALGNSIFDWEAQQRAVDEYMAQQGECDELEIVEICDIPKCANYCVDFDVSITIPFLLSHQETFHQHESEDARVFITGTAGVEYEYVFTDIHFQASQDFEDSQILLSGESTSYNNWIQGSGRVVLGGDAGVQSTTLSFISEDWPSRTGYMSPVQYDVVDTLYKSNEVFTGTTNWVNPDWGRLFDGSYAQSDISYGKKSKFLILKDFGLQIPLDAVILGFVLRIRRKTTQNYVRDALIALVHENEIISDNLSKIYAWPFVATMVSYGHDGVYPGSGSGVSFRSDGEPWSTDSIVDPEFGVAIQVEDTNDSFGCWAQVDGASLEVTYELPEKNRLNFSGEAVVKTSNWSFQPIGSVEFNGIARCEASYVYNSNGLGQLTTAFSVGGSHAMRLEFVSSGEVDWEVAGVRFVGGADFRPSHSHFYATGGSQASGEALVKPYWEVSQSGCCLGGSVLPRGGYIFAASGEMEISGSAISIARKLAYTAGGSVVFSGYTTCKSSAHDWISDGNFVGIFGDAIYRTSSMQSTITAYLRMTIVDIAVHFEEEDESANVDDLSTKVAACGCSNVPLKIDLMHNLNRDNILAAFLTRNGYSLPSIITMRYSSHNNSWQANHSYLGYALNSEEQVRWNLVFELQCTDTVGGLEIGDKVWKLGISIFYKNMSSGNDGESRFLVGLLSRTMCVFDTELDFSLNYNVTTGSFDIVPDITVYQLVAYDDLGIFHGPEWLEDPILAISVSQSGHGNEGNRYLVSV